MAHDKQSKDMQENVIKAIRTIVGAEMQSMNATKSTIGTVLDNPKNYKAKVKINDDVFEAIVPEHVHHWIQKDDVVVIRDLYNDKKKLVIEGKTGHIGGKPQLVFSDARDTDKYVSGVDGVFDENGNLLNYATVDSSAYGTSKSDINGRTSYIHIAYADSVDGSVRFSTSDPTDRAYMGFYSDFNSADSQDYTKYKWMLVKGDKGKDGTSIISVDVEYAKNTSKTTAPTSGWTTTAPQWEPRSYIWQRVKTTYSVGNPTYSKPHAIETDVANSLINYVASRGQNLIANGTGMLKDNTNFPGFTFDGSQAYASDGSFLYKGSSGILTIGEDIPIDPNLSYRFSYYIKGDVEGQTEPVRAYGFVMCKDVDGNIISPRNTMYFSGTTTKLARDLNVGDTKIYIEDSSGWGSFERSHQRSIIIWGYKNSYGYEYPAETYSRNYVRDLWENASSIDKVNHVITLKEPWSLGNFPKGREVSNGNNGSSYKYIAGRNYPIKKQWANYNGTISGMDNTGTNIRDKFQPGTTSIQVGWLLNRYANINTWISNVSFMLDNVSRSDLNETIIEFTSESSEWNIDHNSPKAYPNIVLVNSNNELIQGDITYVSGSSVKVVFSKPVSGKAILN